MAVVPSTSITGSELIPANLDGTAIVLTRPQVVALLTMTNPATPPPFRNRVTALTSDAGIVAIQGGNRVTFTRAQFETYLAAAGAPDDAGRAGVSFLTGRERLVGVAGALVALDISQSAAFRAGTQTGADPETGGPIGTPLAITGTLTSATVGSSTPFVPNVSGGTAPYYFSLAAGTLPGGRGFSGNGTNAPSVTGTYSTAQTVSYTIRVTDAAGATATLAVGPVVVAASFTALPAGTRVFRLQDSISQYDAGVSTTNKGQTAGVPYSARGIGTAFQRLTGDRARSSFMYNYAVAGSMSVMGLSSSLPALISTGMTGLLIDLDGTNSVGVYAKEQILDWMVQKETAWLAASPNNYYMWADTGARGGEVAQTTSDRRWLNAQRKARADANPSRVFYSPEADVTSPTDDGNLIPNAVANDGQGSVHPSNQLALRLGNRRGANVLPLIAAPTSDIWGYTGGTYNLSTNPYGNRIANPLFTGTGGTKANGASASTPVPDNWSLGRVTSDGVTSSTSIDGTIAVNNGVATLTLSGTASGDNLILKSLNHVVANQAAGMRMMMAVDIEGVGITGITSVQIGASVGATGYNYDGASVAASGVNVDVDGTFSKRTAYVPIHYGAAAASNQNNMVILPTCSTSGVAVGGNLLISNPRHFQIPDSVYEAAFPQDCANRWRITFDADATSGQLLSLARVGLAYGPAGKNILAAVGEGVSGFSQTGLVASYGNGGFFGGSISSSAMNANFANLIDADPSTVAATAAGDIATAVTMTLTTRAIWRADRITFQAAPDANYIYGPKTGKVDYSKDGGATWATAFTFACAPWTAAGQIQTLVKP